VSEDIVIELLKKVNEISNSIQEIKKDIAITNTKIEEREKREEKKEVESMKVMENHEKRIAELERNKDRISGGWALVCGIFTLIQIGALIIPFFKR